MDDASLSNPFWRDIMSQAYGRPFRPTELTASTVTSFALPAMAQQLMAEDAFQHAGRNALTLARGSDLTVVLMVLKAQSELHEHQAPGPITVTALSGHLEFEAAMPSEPLRLQTGDTAVCGAHLPHRVKALEDSAFLVVIGGRA
jgi:quercetin dioxygenase-like cupin family protein